MYIFRLHIKPSGSEDWDYSFRYCLKNNLLGIGWTIPNKNNDKIDWGTYQKKAIRKYSKIPQVEYFEKWVTKDCLIWVRNSSNEYYLAKVNSPWEYIDNEKARRADITNVVRVSLKKINNPDDVPGKVIASFRATRTIQEVSSDNIFIYSKLLWNELTNSNYYKMDSNITNYFDFLTDDEAEDILYVYLQYQNYIVVPNTRKKDTLSFEYYLINKKNTYSGPNLPPIPENACHLFRCKVATHSG